MTTGLRSAHAVILVACCSVLPNLFENLIALGEEATPVPGAQPSIT